MRAVGYFDVTLLDLQLAVLVAASLVGIWWPGKAGCTPAGDRSRSAGDPCVDTGCIPGDDELCRCSLPS